MFGEILEQAEWAPIATRRRPKILIVDDDDALADVLSDCLERQGFEAITAETGQAGLDKVRSENPALIVLDLRLPDIDGFTICEQLADSPQTCAIPVIILSGTERPDILRRCRAAGGHYFLRKPYDPNVLLILIRQAISETDGWDLLDD